MHPGVSVILCCHNSSRRLEDTLKHLAQQKVESSIKWEIIVVDNNSDDNTIDVAKGEWRKYKSLVDFFVIKEEQIGLSAARRKGFDAAKYDYILFCDDDNWLQDDYIQLAFEIMNEQQEIGVLGGQSTAVFESTPPEWFDLFAKSYAVGRQYEGPGKITWRHEKLWGAGAVYRKQALNFLYTNGFVQLMSDRVGKKIVSGGDHELCCAIRLAGFELYYDDRLKFVHFMAQSRLNWAWFIIFFRNASYSSVYFDAYSKLDIKTVPKFKRTALYELYVSFLVVLNHMSGFTALFIAPSFNSKKQCFILYYQRHRMFALCRHLFNYNQIIRTVENSRWYQLSAK